MSVTDLAACTTYTACLSPDVTKSFIESSCGNNVGKRIRKVNTKVIGLAFSIS